jgi:ABC-2 type transport system permease protein
MTNLLAAELLKLRTTRIASYLLIATVALTALAVSAAVIIADNAGLQLSTEGAVREVLHVSASGALFVLVLGVIISAGEFRQRTATDTFLTTPDRWKVIAAKLAVAAAVGLLFGALSAGTALFAANHVYSLVGATFPLGSTDAWRILGGSILYAVLFGAVGAATGSLVRNQVAAIVGWLTWMFLVESILLGVAPDLGKWLPSAAGRALVLDPNGDLLGQPVAAIVLVGYALVIAAAAIVVERRRDA